MNDQDAQAPYLPPSAPAVPYMTPAPAAIVLPPRRVQPRRHRGRAVLILGGSLAAIVGIIAALV